MTQPIDPFALQYPDAVLYDDADPLGAECTSELQVLEQDVYHVLIEEPGSNPDDPNRGIGIEGKLSGTEDDFLLLPSAIDAQLREDDRIDESTTTITKVGPSGQQGATYLVNIQIQVGEQVFALKYAMADGVFKRASGGALDLGT